MQNSHYQFRSVWKIEASRKEVWQTLAANPFSWPDWWPELKNVHNVNLKKELTGSSFNCDWKAKGYKLKTNVRVSKLHYLEDVTLQANGDLTGTALCTISEVDGKTHIEIVMRATTNKRWMNLLSPILRPIFAYNHHLVMRRGERGLQNYLQSRRSQQ
jgi:hypothetical protein